MRPAGDRHVPVLLVAFALAVVGAIKGTRLFWESIDNATSWLVEQCDDLDLGWDVPDYVPDGLAGDR